MATGFTVRLQGPLFEANVSEKVQNAVRKGLDQLALQGQRMVQEQLYPGHGVKTGNLRRSVVGTAEVWNKATVGTSVNYGEFVERGHRSFGGYHMFGNAQKQLEGMDLSGILGRLITEQLK